MGSVERFAGEAVAFRDWLLAGSDSGESAARRALIHLTRLYLEALELPSPWNNEFSDEPDAFQIREEERLAASTACRRMPFDFYREVFDPFSEPTVEPLYGSLADDIGDIYRDIVTGLLSYEAGKHPLAIWEWGFRFQIHWGEHATSAIRALHCWLATNAPGELTCDSRASRS
jgi:hypothetical protein